MEDVLGLETALVGALLLEVGPDLDAEDGVAVELLLRFQCRLDFERLDPALARRLGALADDPDAASGEGSGEWEEGEGGDRKDTHGSNPSNCLADSASCSVVSSKGSSSSLTR